MNSENLILRETEYAPLVNKDDFLDNTDFDSNMINIYEDFVALCVTNGVIAYSEGTEYDDSIVNYATYDGKLWKFVNAVSSIGITPGTNESYWIEVFPTELAHRKNSDTILDEGGLNEVSASEIRAFIDAGLTSTTNLSLSEHSATSIRINSSTGTDVTLNGATELKAGLLTAEDKQKLKQISGINTGDQTLESLGAEATVNKVVDFSIVDNITFPTTEAVNNQITDLVPTVVDSVMEGYQKTQSSTALTFMFSGTNSDISTYKKCFDLLNYTAGASANNGGISTSTTPVLQVAFATEPSYPNLTVIPIGNILIHFETQKGAGSNSYHSYVEIYKRNLAGTETLLLTSDNSSTTASNDLIQNTVVAVNPALINLLSTDRLVFKIYSVMTSGTATITSYFDDASMTRVELPFVVDLTTYATLTDLATKEDSITAGTTSQYWRGDKSWQTLNATAVGLGNVPNTDATNASNLASGTVPTARLGSGAVGSGLKYLADDNTWKTILGSNIYTSDGTLGSARTVTMAGNQLSFVGANNRVAILGNGTGTSFLQITNGSSGSTTTDGILIGYDSDNEAYIKCQDGNQLILANSGGNALLCTATNVSIPNRIIVGAPVSSLGTGAQLQVISSGTTSSTYPIFISGLASSRLHIFNGAGDVFLGADSATISARLQVKGSGTTSATTSLLVQNSAGTQCFKIGDNNSIGMYNTTPVQQATTSISSSTLVSNLGTPLTSTDTIDGYTLQQVVKALRNLGILA